MVRGQKNSFFMAVRDQNMESDALIEVIIKLNNKTNKGGLFVDPKKVSVAYSGQILALELDPLDYYDYNPDHKIDANVGYDQVDQVYIIDGKLNLIKVGIEREPVILFKRDLSQFDTIKDKLEGVRELDFVRLGISERVLSI